MEIEIEVHKDIAEKVARKLEEVMVASFNYYAPDVPMKANAVIDVCWVH